MQAPRQSRHPPAAPNASGGARRQPRRQAVQPWAAHRPSPQAISQRFQASQFARLMVQLLAQRDQHLGNRDFHGTRGLARAAQARSVRQMMIRRQPVVHRRQQRADRPRIHAAVSMAADVAKNRAGIQARAAANAKQALAQRTFENPRAAIVQQHDMKLFRPVKLSRSPRAVDDRGINRQLLPGRRARQ